MTELEAKVFLVQEYFTEDCSEVQDFFQESLDELDESIAEFVLENQGRIKDIYQKLKNKRKVNNLMIESVADTDALYHKYVKYHDSMLDYITGCLITEGAENTSGSIGMAVEEMQKKDEKFFDTEISYVEECAPDAMRNVEALVDLKGLVARIREEGEKILAIQCTDTVSKNDLYGFYCKSTLTFCLKMLDAIKAVLVQVNSTLDAPSEPESRPYKYF